MQEAIPKFPMLRSGTELRWNLWHICNSSGKPWEHHSNKPSNITHEKKGLTTGNWVQLNKAQNTKETEDEGAQFSETAKANTINQFVLEMPYTQLLITNEYYENRRTLDLMIYHELVVDVELWFVH